MVADLDHTWASDDVFGVDNDVENQAVETKPLANGTESELANRGTSGPLTGSTRCGLLRAQLPPLRRLRVIQSPWESSTMTAPRRFSR